MLVFSLSTMDEVKMELSFRSRFLRIWISYASSSMTYSGEKLRNLNDFSGSLRNMSSYTVNASE